jgi:hypothetical protein
MPDEQIQADADVVLRVMERHGLANQDVAQLTGYHHGQISRLLSGQHAMPVGVIRALIRRTRDPELIEHFLADDPRGRRADDALFVDAVRVQQRAHSIAESLLSSATHGGMHRTESAELERLASRARELASSLTGIAARATTAAMQNRSSPRLPAEGVVA